jgi:hypothetical protein
MSDQRLDALEQRSTQQGSAWLEAAAQQQGWHDPSVAAKYVDPATIATPIDANRVVGELSRSQPFLVRQQQTDEQRWGAEILAGLERGGR